MNVELPKSLDEVIRVAEELFDCRIGFPGPYAIPPDYDSRYVVLSWITTETEHAAAYLRLHLINSLHRLRATINDVRVPLYWRHLEKVEEEVQTIYHYEPIWRAQRSENLCKIRTRIAIPGANWSLVETQTGLEPTPRIPVHNGGCSNQNPLNPIGMYVGAETCSCRKA